MSFIDRMLSIDRRVIFVLIALAVIIPMMLDLVLIVRPSPIVQSLFDRVEALPAGSKVLMTMDFGPSTAPENRPMADALFRHCLIKGHKVYIVSLWATGDAEAVGTIGRITKEFPEKVYGEDYIHLGFKAGGAGLINAILADFKGFYTTDINQKDIKTFPMMDPIRGLADFNKILAVCSGRPGLREWIQFAGDRANVPVGGGVTAVEAPELYPYYPAQISGLMGGLQGAAEYEAALVRVYPQFKETSTMATKRMGPQNVAHWVIITFIVIGNIAFFLKQRGLKAKKK